MYTFIGSMLLFSLLASIPRTIESVAPPVLDVIPQEEVELTIPEKIDLYASKYQVSKELAHYIAEEESGYNKNAEGDLTITCRNPKSPHNGQPVYARGVYQITRCYHPNVTDEQAFDPDFNIEYAMKLIAQGTETCKRQFTTCRDYYRNY